MVDKRNLTKTTTAFLESLANIVKAEFGNPPLRQQVSTWMVNIEGGGKHSEYFKRTIVDVRAIDSLVQHRIRDRFPHQQELEELVIQAGIPAATILYGYIRPLVLRWLKLPNPFGDDKSAIFQTVDEFCDFVLNGINYTRSIQAITGIILNSEPVVLEEGITIRSITEEELWEFGDTDQAMPLLNRLDFYTIPHEDWKIIDIQVQYVRNEASIYASSAVHVIREAILALLRLLSPTSMEIVDLGIQDRQGFGAASLMFSTEMRRQRLGQHKDPLIIDEVKINRIQGFWLKLREIYKSENHFLRIPAQRLVDGGRRTRDDDAVIDYAIGLEVLLTEGISDELRYRFSLRGATIVNWDNGNTEDVHNQLREFYKIRSGIVHGKNIERNRILEARKIGDQMLRQIWWWYFDTGLSLKKATSRVDKRILGK